VVRDLRAADGSSLTAGWLMVSVVGTGPINMSNPGFVNCVIRYGGVDLVMTGLKFDTIEHHGFVLAGVVRVGDLSGFTGELLEVDLSSGSPGKRFRSCSRFKRPSSMAWPMSRISTFSLATPTRSSRRSRSIPPKQQRRSRRHRGRGPRA